MNAIQLAVILELCLRKLGQVNQIAIVTPLYLKASFSKYFLSTH